jgi:hypothetical protein
MQRRVLGLGTAEQLAHHPRQLRQLLGKRPHQTRFAHAGIPPHHPHAQAMVQGFGAPRS